LALHPTRRTSESARRGLDKLLAQEQRQAHTLGFESPELWAQNPLGADLPTSNGTIMPRCLTCPGGLERT
jgi:hypothetical protein